MNDNLIPQQILKKLDKHLVSQDEVKKKLAISIRNIYRRNSIIDKKIKDKIISKNIMLMGSIGTGKTEIITQLTKLLDVPFIKIVAHNYPKIKCIYQSYNADSILEELILLTYEKLKTNRINKLKKKYQNMAFNKISQLITNYEILDIKEQKIIKNKIKLGDYQKIEINELKLEAIKNIENSGIIFIDDIDKIMKIEPECSSELYQPLDPSILSLLNNEQIKTKYGYVKTEHILLIATGTFVYSSLEDLMPELQNKFPIKIKLSDLNKNDFIKILTEIDINLITQYKELLKTDNIILDFNKNAIDEIANFAIKRNKESENIGAYRLTHIFESLLNNIMYKVPFDKKLRKKITKKDILGIQSSNIEVENLDDHIL